MFILHFMDSCGLNLMGMQRRPARRRELPVYIEKYMGNQVVMSDRLWWSYAYLKEKDFVEESRSWWWKERIENWATWRFKSNTSAKTIQGYIFHNRFRFGLRCVKHMLNRKQQGRCFQSPIKALHMHFMLCQMTMIMTMVANPLATTVRMQ